MILLVLYESLWYIYAAEIPPFNDAMTATQKTEIFYSYGQEIRDAFSAGQQFAIIEGPTGGGLWRLLSKASICFLNFRY